MILVLLHLIMLLHNYNLNHFLGKKTREVSDKFKNLHESVKQRWQLREDYRPENLEKHKQQLDKTKQSSEV